ncbi:fibronectin type III domain-containing protein [candidate division KSB1 bacterium]|nr:MAG: fibronectin type III domain-containing protein [candidate division KSB1 bacterium]
MKKVTAIIAASLLVMFAFIGCGEDDDTENPPVNNPPSMPTGLAANQTVRTAVSLQWTDVADEDTFVVQRSGDSTAWGALLGTAANIVTANDNTILANHKYWYKVRAGNAYGNSDYTAPVSIWTWPGVYDFATDQTDHFNAASLEGTGDYHEWDWDQTAQAGKLTITQPDNDQHIVSVSSDYTMPNQGWFEAKFKVGQWSGSGATASYLNWFVEREIQDPTDDIIAIFFSADSTVFGYYASPQLMRLATNPALPLMTDNAWHTVKLFHSGQNWTLYIDGTQRWSGAIANVAANTVLYEEFQFDRGEGPDDQVFWVDDIAGAMANPIIDESEDTPIARNASFTARPAVKKK